MGPHVERTGNGPDLVLLHGWALPGAVWAPLAGRLARSFRLHIVDLPGHGRSRGVPFGDLDALARTIATVIPRDAIVCGWSLGAFVAMRLAGLEASGVRALALIAATPSFIRRAQWPHGTDPAILDGFASGLRERRDETLRAFLHLNAKGEPDAKARVRELAAIVDAGEAPDGRSLAAGLDILRDADLRAQAGTLTQPCVVIHGSRDALVPAEAGRWLARTLPRAGCLEIGEAAHVPFASHPDAVAAALESLHG